MFLASAAGCQDPWILGWALFLHLRKAKCASLKVLIIAAFEQHSYLSQCQQQQVFSTLKQSSIEALSWTRFSVWMGSGESNMAGPLDRLCFCSLWGIKFITIIIFRAQYKSQIIRIVPKYQNIRCFVLILIETLIVQLTLVSSFQNKKGSILVDVKICCFIIFWLKAVGSTFRTQVTSQ